MTETDASLDFYNSESLREAADAKAPHLEDGLVDEGTVKFRHLTSAGESI